MRNYILYIILFAFMACKSKADQADEPGIMGIWRLNDIGQLVANEGGNSFAKEAELKTKVQAGQLLGLFSDNSYTILAGEGEYETGKWKLTKQGAWLDLGNSKMLASGEMKMAKNESGRFMLSIANASDNVLTTFVKDAESAKKYMDDPYHSSNNVWRIRPAKEEDHNQISKRFLNYFQHVALILKTAKDQKQQVVSFEFSKGPIRIYNGGIGVHPYKIVPKEWKNCFFDDRSALTACIMFENYLAQSVYRGVGTGNWIIDDYNIMLAIYSGMSSIDYSAK